MRVDDHYAHLHITGQGGGYGRAVHPQHGEAQVTEYQQIISDAAKNAQTLNRGLVKQQTEDCVKELEAKGMTVVYPDLEPFRNATTGVLEMFRTGYGEELIEYITEE